MEWFPGQAKDVTTIDPAPGVTDVVAPRVIVPRVWTVAEVAPGQVTVSIRVMVPVGDSVAVQLTPPVIVSFCPITTGFGVDSNITALETVAAGARYERVRTTRVTAPARAQV